MANRFEDKVASVSKALTILEVLSNEPEGLGLLEISSRVDMHKTTVYRLLTSLMEKNFVEQDEQTGRYSMGLKILSLANAFYEKVDIRIIIRKYISGLLAGEVSSSSEDQSSEEGFLLVSKRMEHNFVVMDCLEGGMLAPLRWRGTCKGEHHREDLLCQYCSLAARQKHVSIRTYCEAGSRIPPGT